MPRGGLDPREFIRVHSGMPEHPKVEPLSDGAFRCLMEAWCLCRRTGNDGWLPLRVWTKRWPEKARAEVVAAGLAHLHEDGVEVHDWLDHQPAAAELDRLRTVRAEVGRKGGQRSAETRRARGKPTTDAEANASPIAQANGAPNQNQTPDQNTQQPVNQTAQQNGSKVQADLDLDLDSGSVGGDRPVSNAPATRDAPPPATPTIEANGLGPEPPRWCPEHITTGDPGRPCRGCQSARQIHTAWTDARKQQLAAAGDAKRAAIAACDLCDTEGWRIPPPQLAEADPPANRCNHRSAMPLAWHALIQAMLEDIEETNTHV